MDEGGWFYKTFAYGPLASRQEILPGFSVLDSSSRSSSGNPDRCAAALLDNPPSRCAAGGGELHLDVQFFCTQFPGLKFTHIIFGSDNNSRLAVVLVVAYTL